MTEFKRPTTEGAATIAVLSHPFQFAGDEQTAVTIPALRGKHLARIPFKLGELPSIGLQIEWAGSLVLPVGVLDEMHPSDAFAIALEVYGQLGKSLATGESASE